MKSTAKHGGGNVIVRGCFDEFRVDDLYRVRGIFKKVLLLGIFFFGQRFNQEQETDPNHKKTEPLEHPKGQLENMEVSELSPDMNPIELVGPELDQNWTRGRARILNM